MSLNSPARNTALPLRIQERLNNMFARTSGFSGPQILDFFSRYDINIEPYPPSGAPSRKVMFEDCLARFDRETQFSIIEELLNYDGPFRHGPPSADDIELVRHWLRSKDEVIDNNRNFAVRVTSDATSHSDNPQWDVFLSHAWEDKDEFARPLAHALQNHGLRVWFDEFTLRVGDSLRRSIDKGLASARYGVVIISPSFLKKEWPQKELDGLMAREANGHKVILPVWHNVDADSLRTYSPMLADRLATTSSKGLDRVIDDLLEALR
jgi:hypothetical protein